MRGGGTADRPAVFFDDAQDFRTWLEAATNWVVTAKQEATRDRRMAQVVEDYAHLRLITSQRYGTPPSWVDRLRSELG